MAKRLKIMYLTCQAHKGLGISLVAKSVYVLLLRELLQPITNGNWELNLCNKTNLTIAPYVTVDL